MSEIDKMKMSLAFSLISVLRSVDVLIKRDLFSQLMNLFYLGNEDEKKNRTFFSELWMIEEISFELINVWFLLMWL